MLFNCAGHAYSFRSDFWFADKIPLGLSYVTNGPTWAGFTFRVHNIQIGWFGQYYTSWTFLQVVSPYNLFIVLLLLLLLLFISRKVLKNIPVLIAYDGGQHYG